MAKTELEIQKTFIRGMIAEVGAEDKFKAYLEQLHKQFDSLESDEDKGTYIMALAFFSIETQENL